MRKRSEITERKKVLSDIITLFYFFFPEPVQTKIKKKNLLYCARFDSTSSLSMEREKCSTKFNQYLGRITALYTVSI